MTTRVLLVLFAVIVLSGSGALQDADAQVRRCTTPDGVMMYTDRPCAAVGAIPSNAPHGAVRSGNTQAQLPRISCQRNLRGLIRELGSAIRQRDANALAGLYHWPGISHDGGYRILERLEAIAQRPLLDITAQRPARTAVTRERRGFSGWTSARDLPAAAAQPPPTSLRVEQTRESGAGTVQTVFALHRHLDCWWLSL